MPNILVPSKPLSWGAVMKVAQQLFDAKLLQDRKGLAARQEKLMAMATKKAYMHPILGQHIATVDARVYHNIIKDDPHFFDDPANMKRFLNDNPNMVRRRPADYRSKYFNVGVN